MATPRPAPPACRALPGALARAALALLVALTLPLCAQPAVGPPVTETPAAGAWECAPFALTLPVPPDWTVQELARSETSLHVTFTAPGLAAQVTLRVNPPGAASVEALSQAAWAALEADDAYVEPARTVRAVRGGEHPGFTVLARQGEAPLRLRQVWLQEEGRLLLLQDLCLDAQEAHWTPVFDALWDGLQVGPLPRALQRRHALQELAARCGSEVRWAADWEEACARARAEERPILVAARFYPGFQISDDMLAGPFMDRDIIDLVNERTVPLRVTEPGELPLDGPGAYGLGPFSFGTAALLVTPGGRVLAESPAVTDAFLCRALAGLPGGPAGRSAGEGTRLARAEALARRGELEAARELLQPPESAAEHRLLASIARRLWQGERALASLEAARGAPGGAALGVDLDVDRALLLLATGRAAEGRELLERVLAGHGDHPRAPEARLLLAQALWHQEDTAAARPLLEQVVDEDGSTRWAWSAAATLLSTAFTLELSGRLTWPPRDELEAFLTPPRYAEGAAPDLAQVERQALTFLLARQRSDGSWPNPADLGREEAGPPHDFTQAIGALALRALLPHRDQPPVAEASEAALAFLLEADAAARALGHPAHFMDYAVWSRAYLLWTLADVAAAGLRPADELAPRAALLVQELAERRKPGGGWSYYMTADATTEAPAARFSFSFVTAVVLVALQRAEAVGWPVPPELLADGLDDLTAMHNGDQTYSYMLGPADSGRDRLRAGAAGRGPLCALPLVRAGRLEPGALAATLQVLDELGDPLVAEAGKSLMHTGAEGQGSHYLLFDLAHAAEATAELPRSERQRHRARLAELLLRLRTEEGAFLDSPLLGRPYGTAMALIALRFLREDEGARTH